jgi:glycine/D-amino acid oxidase-like deaminating enzyme
MNNFEKIVDIIIIGAGIIGTSIGYGLSRKKASVILIDEGSTIHRASTGNFGLVWVQGKGLGDAPYARWTHEAARKYPGFLSELKSETQIDVHYQKTGGIVLTFGESEYKNRSEVLDRLRSEAIDNIYDCEMLDHQSVQQQSGKLPLGEAVSGGSFSPHDGHLNPLLLLKALFKGFKQNGGQYIPNHPAISIKKEGDIFIVQTPKQSYRSKKVVISTGNSTPHLAAMVGLHTPIRPQKGQILVTERKAPLLKLPVSGIRQTNEGSFLLGHSNEEAGFDVETTLDIIKKISQRFVRVFPTLSDIRVVRCWAALRTLTPDSLPIYHASSSHPGAYVVSSHSSVTLASLHATSLVDWIWDDIRPGEFETFSLRRFCV